MDRASNAKLGSRASNNEVEYEALIAGHRATKSIGMKEVEMFSDLRLVESQIKENFEARDHRMSQYLKMFESLQAGL